VQKIYKIDQNYLCMVIQLYLSLKLPEFLEKIDYSVLYKLLENPKHRNYAGLNATYEKNLKIFYIE